MLPRLGLLLSTLLFLASCAMPPDYPHFQPSDNLPAYDQERFDHYVRDTRAWIAENRAFLSDDRRVHAKKRKSR